MVLRRVLYHLLLLLGLCLGFSVSAHPMGTLSVSRFAVLDLSPDSLRLQYSVDFAEIPSQYELRRQESLGDAYAETKLKELIAGVVIEVDGAVVPLELSSKSVKRGQGEGDLPLVLLSGTFTAKWPKPPTRASQVVLRDSNFAGTPGWRSIRARGHGVGLSSPSYESLFAKVGESVEPFQYDSDNAPSDNEAQFSATIGTETVFNDTVKTQSTAKKPDPLVALLQSDGGFWVILLALLGSMMLGAGHALSPGHGKTVVAAYLVGERGTISHALLLGVVVTMTHVSSVLLLGAVALWLSQYILPERLYPILGLLSGIGVVVVGFTLFRTRLKSFRAVQNPPSHEHHDPSFHQDYGHPYYHDHEHDHSHHHNDHDDHEHHDGPGGHTHVYSDEQGKPVDLWRLLVLGVSGGMVPCPAALVVLLAAISMHRILFGMALIVSFSMGLAMVLMALGILVVRAKKFASRFDGLRGKFSWVPVMSAVLIIGLGLTIAVQAAVEGRLL